MLEREPASHKGQNGRVAIIGGNELFHGAPILCALAVEYSGVDLVYPWLPPCHAQVARTYSLNFIVQTFKETHLTPLDVRPILHFCEKIDAVVLGPGLGTDPETQKAVKELLAKLQVPTVVDASGLIYTNTFPPMTVLTPHRGEFTKVTGDEPEPKNVQKWAKEMKCLIVCKGPQDIISDGTNTAINNTGNSLMTVGGTGDVLSGFIGGLMAQGLTGFEAAVQATKILGQIGDDLAARQASLRAHDLVKMLPEFLFKAS